MNDRLWNEDRELEDLDFSVPDWIDQDITTGTIAAIEYLVDAIKRSN